MTQPYEQTETLGDARVDDALGRLEELAQRPVEEHVEIFEHVHARLQGALQDAARHEAELPDAPADAQSQP